MSKNQKIVIAVVVVVLAVLAGAAAWVLKWYLPARKSTATNNINDAETDPSEGEILCNGSSGVWVTKLQIALNLWRKHIIDDVPTDAESVPVKALAEDGIFGAETLKAVKMYWAKDYCTVKEVMDLEEKVQAYG